MWIQSGWILPAFTFSLSRYMPPIDDMSNNNTSQGDMVSRCICGRAKVTVPTSAVNPVPLILQDEEGQKVDDQILQFPGQVRKYVHQVL